MNELEQWDAAKTQRDKALESLNTAKRRRRLSDLVLNKLDAAMLTAIEGIIGIRGPGK